MTDSNSLPRPSNRLSIPSIRLTELIVLFGILGIFGILALATIRQGAPLGHDEAVYSLRSRQFTTGTTPISYWLAYRAPGLPVILRTAWLGPASEPFLRILVAGFGVVMIVSTWFIGRVLGGRRVGLIAAAGVAVTPAFVVSSTQVWPDVPGATIGLVTVGFLIWAFTRNRLPLWVLIVAPLATAATLVRFGAPLPIAIGLASVAIWHWDITKKESLRVGSASVLTTVGIATVLFVPAATQWAQRYGDPISPYAAITSAKSSNAFPWYQGMVDYWELKDQLLSGNAAVVLILGIAIAVVLLARSPSRVNPLWLPLIIGFGTVAIIALILHGEIRYLSPALPWIWIAAAFGLAKLSELWSRDLTIAIASTVFVLLAINTYPLSGLQNANNRARHQVLKEAATAIDSATPDFACSVLTGDTALVGWYSKCPTNRFDTGMVVIDNIGFPDGPTFLFFMNGGERQPIGEVREAYVAETSGIAESFGDRSWGRRQYVELYEVIP